jgi:AraC family L-rhamnose operon transcriptional activator RhaR/AraC family L-rhamnose operon regulatory protein RhaS
VVDYLENNFEHQIYIEKLAEISCMSTRNFMRTFKGAVGLSPINYLKQVRLQNARKQLRETTYNVTEVAAQSGFTDSNSFIKSFKQAYGVTPNKFRKQW